jgi:signal transduction histidine kinase
MRSIRLSLAVYFLALLALALGTASWLIDRTARRTLEDKRRATEELVRSQYSERCREAEQKLNDTLLSQAQTLATLTRLEFVDRGDRGERGRPRFHREFHALGALSAGLAPGGYVAVPTWALQGWRGQYNFFNFWLYWHPDIRLNTGELLADVDGQAPEYFQIDGSWGRSYHSASLEDRSLPAVPQTFAPDKSVYWEWGDTWLDADTPVRRVILKQPAGRPGRPEVFTGPTIFVQCASDLRRLEAHLSQLAAQRDGDLAAVEADTAETLAGMRRRLLGLTTATFLAGVIGCFGLVWLGLLPLGRLTEAVSRVSPRDFRLPVEEGRLPRELRPIAGRLADTLAQLERAFAREKQATADMSHELRTPLAALLATTDLALRKNRAPAEYREFLDECRRSARQMNETVERMLALARLDAGVDTVRPRPLDAADVAEQAAAVVRPLAEARGLRLRVHLPAQPGAARVVADPDKLREVLTNLLHNAVQYNRSPGPDGGGTVDLAVDRSNGSLVLEVRDTGIGIPPAALGHIFERYYRADPSRGQDGLHAGLGLSIVREYVSLMGGTVAVESTEGKGSTFRVWLPVSGGVGG